MNKSVGVFCFFIITFLFLSQINQVFGQDSITGKVITGKATSSNTAVSISVVGVPSIYLLYPENKTYLKRNLTLSYSYAGSPTNLFYSIDQASNISLSGFPSIVFSEGQRRLDLWANSSYGLANNNKYFTVNTSLLNILYSNYNGSTRGSSTDFLSIAYEDLHYLNSTTIEDTRYGKIVYNFPINVENDSINNDSIVDIDSNIMIVSHSIIVDSSILPNFNKSAKLYFYFLPFTTPKILVDGAVCPSTVCTNKVYSNGNLSFDVTSFSNYSIEETTVEVPAPSSGGGGGGGGGPSTYHSIDIISPGAVELGRNDELVVPITIKNPESKPMRGIRLFANSSTKELSAIFENITIDELLPGENKTVMLFLKSTNLVPGNYDIELVAEVTDPKFKDSEKMYIRAVEIVGKVEVIERILLAQELFRENPECLELNDLLIQAQNLAENGQVNEARTIVQEAISRCRDLVTNKEFPSANDYQKVSAWRTPIEWALVLIVITLIIFLIFRRPKIDLGRRRAKKKRRSLLKRMFGRR